MQSEPSVGVDGVPYVYCCVWYLACSGGGFCTCFRQGEALASLCVVARLSIITRAASDSFATRLVFDHHGRQIGREAAAREVRLVRGSAPHLGSLRFALALVISLT